MKKNGMLVTSAIYMLLLIVAGLVFASIYNGEKKKNLAVIETQKQYYTGVISSRDSLINETMKTFDEIDKQLNMIKGKQNIISMNANNPEFNKSKKEKILRDISVINSLLDANKKKIGVLNAQLESYGVEILGLKEKVAQLNDSLNQSEIVVSDLKNTVNKKDTEISQLNGKVNDQTKVIASKDDLIEDQIAELNKAFVAYGTKKELIGKVVLIKSGVLGLGKKDINLNNEFKQIDISKVTSIPVNSKSVELLSSHSKNSYKFVYDGKIITDIEITNPVEFWKTKYVIIQVK